MRRILSTKRLIGSLGWQSIRRQHFRGGIRLFTSSHDGDDNSDKLSSFEMSMSVNVSKKSPSLVHTVDIGSKENLNRSQKYGNIITIGNCAVTHNTNPLTEDDPTSVPIATISKPEKTKFSIMDKAKEKVSIAKVSVDFFENIIIYFNLYNSVLK